MSFSLTPYIRGGNDNEREAPRPFPFTALAGPGRDLDLGCGLAPVKDLGHVGLEDALVVAVAHRRLQHHPDATRGGASRMVVENLTMSLVANCTTPALSIWDWGGAILGEGVSYFKLGGYDFKSKYFRPSAKFSIGVPCRGAATFFCANICKSVQFFWIFVFWEWIKIQIKTTGGKLKKGAFLNTSGGRGGGRG